jgi:hypothetical protein
MYLHSKPGMPPDWPLAVGSPQEQLAARGMEEKPPLGDEDQAVGSHQEQLAARGLEERPLLGDEDQAVGSPQEQLTVKGLKEMPSLGELLDSGGTSRCSVRYRLNKATAQFNMPICEGLLVGKEHVLPKFRDFFSRIVPIATLGCGGWAWCRATHDIIQGWESRMLRRICPAPKVDGEDVGVYLQRSVRYARKIYRKHGFPALTQIVLDRIWARSLRCTPANAPGPLCLWTEVLRHRDRPWWRSIRHLARLAAEAGEAVERWRHHSEFRKARTAWEDVFCHLHGDMWLEEAGAGTWRHQKETFLTDADKSLSVSDPRNARRGMPEAPERKVAAPRRAAAVPHKFTRLARAGRQLLNEGDNSAVVGTQWRSRPGR